MDHFKFLTFGFERRGLTWTVYLIQLVLAITIGLQVYQVIDASIGQSVSLEGLKLGNAHMVVNDLLNVHGASLSPLIGQVRWFILIYLIFAAFVHSGIWTSIIHKDDDLGFWVGGARYFLPCLGIGAFYMLLLLLISALIWIPFLSKFGYWMEHLISEAPLVWGIIVLFVLWSVLCVFLFVGSAMSKILLIREGLSVRRSIWKGIKFSTSSTVRLFPALFIVLLIFVFLYVIHGFVDDWPMMSTTFGILLLFGVQQTIVWIKIALRLSTYHYILENAPQYEKPDNSKETEVIFA